MEEDFLKTLQVRTELMKKLAIGQTALQIFDNESLPFFLCVFDLETLEFLTVSKSCKKVLGYDQSEMEGEKFLKFMANNIEAKKGLDAIDENLEKGKNVSGFKNNYKHKNGSIVEIIWYTGKGKDSKTFAIGIPKNN